MRISLLLRIFIALSPLAVEIFVCRTTLHAFLGSNLLVMGIYSRDVLWPLIFAIISFLILLDQIGGFRISLNLKVLLLNLFALLIELATVFHFDRLSVEIGSGPLVALLITVGVLISITALFVCIDPIVFQGGIRKKPSLMFGTLAIMGAMTSYERMLEANWRWMGNLTGHAVYYFLKAVGLAVTLETGRAISLRHSLFSATIYQPCAGLEGIFFFMFVFLFLLMSEGDRYRPMVCISVFICGLLYMFFLNVIRIAVFFYAAISMTNRFGSGSATKVFVGAFHNNIGWLLYVIGLFLFFHAIARVHTFTSSVRS